MSSYEHKLPEGWADKEGLLALQSRVSSHREFLLRPDLGRRLSETSLERLRADYPNSELIEYATRDLAAADK